MTTRHACPDRREAIAALVIGSLEPAEAAWLQEHLRTCANCRSLYDVLAREEQDLREVFDEVGRAAAPAGQKILSRAPQAIHLRIGAKAAGLLTAKGGRAMKRAATIAVAAGLLLAFAGLIAHFLPHQRSAGVAFAQVIDNVLAVRTVTYDLTIQGNGARPYRVSRCMSLEPGRFRQEWPDGPTMVMNGAEGKMIALDPNTKTATLIERTEQLQPETFECQIAQLARVRGVPHADLGQTEIDGRPAQGFRAQKEGVEYVVWADMQTGLPITIKLTSSILLGKMKATMTNFRYNVDLDEALFSVAVPEGYTLNTLKRQEVQAGTGKPGEADLVAALDTITGLNDGSFPTAFDVEALKPILRRAGAGLKEMPLEQRLKHAVNLIAPHVKALMFAARMAQGSDWHYVGQDVKRGDAHKPVCWWKKPDAPGVYRVVYGDLSVRDVPADQLPAAP